MDKVKLSYVKIVPDICTLYSGDKNANEGNDNGTDDGAEILTDDKKLSSTDIRESKYDINCPDAEFSISRSSKILSKVKFAIFNINHAELWN